MCRFFFTFCFISFFYYSSGFSQTNGNIPLSFKSRFDRFWGVADVWGVQINGNNYALVTLDGGLSIINTNNPLSPEEIVHINRFGYDQFNRNAPRIWMPDVETFTKNGITYAYLATNNIDPLQPNMPLVIIINVNAAISNAPPPPNNEIFIDPFTPSGPVYVGKINDLSNVFQSHTLTIEDGYLYVASLNQYLPIWYLGNNPTNPTYVTSLTITTPNSQLHEMYIDSDNPNTATVFAACVRAGLQVYNIIYIPQINGSISANVTSAITHLYDFDRAYPNQMWSSDPYFDYRVTHSAWLSDDEQYVFTTDEIHATISDTTKQYVGSGSNPDPNLYYTTDPILRSPRREGAFLRVWDAFRLGQSNSFKGGYYVSEESPWGITDLTEIDTAMVPNSVHQMFIRGNYMYLAHYTQGFRMLNISNPLNIIELGWYDDHPPINFNPNSIWFFRRFKGRWFNGIYGVFPDPNRSNICYAGGYPGGFYIFDVTPPPYPPTGLTINEDLNHHPMLNWNISLGQHHYNIYRLDSWGGGIWEYLGQTTGNTYTDQTLTFCHAIPPAQCPDVRSFYYYVTVVNNALYESNASNRVEARLQGGPPYKIVADPNSNKPIEFSLAQNYPNPFNPSTNINYSIKTAGLVTLNVFDILGNRVAEIVNERKEPGNYSVAFNAVSATGGLPSGIYVYRLTADNYVATKKFILLK
jgi:hypothetical protein